MKFDNVDISTYGAMIMDDYNVGSANVNSGFILSASSTTPIGYSMRIGEREFTVPIAFVADSTLNAIANKSKLATDLCKGTVEIYDDENDIYYSAVLTGISNEQILMDNVYTAEFEFSGVMHGALISFTQSGSFTPKGYAENGEDCRISVTARTLESDGTYKVADITFSEDAVTNGTSIVIDGFDKIVYINGANGMQYCDLVSFPRLYPGKSNYIECKDPVKIEYYPVYK